jgi:hypothetical protein
MGAKYHTLLWETYPDERNVYHNMKKCPAGSRIKPEHRSPGMGHGRDRCKLCIERAAKKAAKKG